MGQKDITQKILEMHNDVFADIVNGLVFKGKKVVKENELFDTANVASFRSGQKITHQERDVTKVWKKSSIRIAMWGLENQMKPCKDMPLRILAYDGVSYKRQLLELEKERKYAEEKGLEFDIPEKYYPVVTFVVYLGEQPWNKNRSLLEVVDVKPEFRQFVNDYKLNLIDVSNMPEEQAQLFHSDFRSLIDWLKKRKDQAYEVLDRKIDHPEDYGDLLYAMSGDERVLRAIEGKGTKGAGLTMCEFIDRLEEKGRIEGIKAGRIEGIKAGRIEGIKAGRIEGIKEGRIEGIKEGEIRVLSGLVEDGILSLQQAAGRINIDVDTFNALVKKMKEPEEAKAARKPFVN